MSAGPIRFGGGASDDEEIGYLRSLPAVHDVRDSRIILYSDEFKQECLDRYYAGEAPSSIFRSAGLDPALIGRKRIERCVARWKKEHRRHSCTRTPKNPTEHESSETAVPSHLDIGTCMLIIRQQARRIQRFEREIEHLHALQVDNNHTGVSDDSADSNGETVA